MKTVPVVGVSMQPMRLSSVDLPLPEGPAIARNTPFLDAQDHADAAPEPADRRGDSCFETFSTRIRDIERETGRVAIAILLQVVCEY